MLSRLRAQDGFTLIELLVVVAIIGILAAIALPGFLGQRAKAADGTAKTHARTAVTAMETMQISNGVFPADPADLVEFEPSLTQATNLTLTSGANSYRVSIDSSDLGRTFWVERSGNQPIEHGCAPAGEGGCSDSGSW